MVRRTLARQHLLGGERHHLARRDLAGLDARCQDVVLLQIVEQGAEFCVVLRRGAAYLPKAVVQRLLKGGRVGE